MQIGEYKLVDVLKRKSRDTDKEYFIAYLAFKSDSSVDLINVLVDEKLAKILDDCIMKHNTNMTNFVKVEYNSYQKKYQPKLVGIN